MILEKEIVRLENMEFEAFHGCLESERMLGNRFRVDVEMSYPMKKAAKSDDLALAVNYAEVYQVVKEQMEIPSSLLENVAWRILDAIREKFPVYMSTVTVTKFNPPLDGKVEKSSVTMSFGNEL